MASLVDKASVILNFNDDFTDQGIPDVNKNSFDSTGAVVSTVQKKLGKRSCYLSSSSTYLISKNSTYFDTLFGSVSNSWSVSVWIYITQMSSPNTISMLGGSNIIISFPGQVPTMSVISSGGTINVTHNTAVAINNWHHILFVFNQGSYTNCKIYVNGASNIIGSGTTSGTVTTQSLMTIGRSGNSGAGYIDAFALFPYNLSATEAALLYNNGTGVQLKTTEDSYLTSESLFPSFGNYNYNSLYKMDIGGNGRSTPFSKSKIISGRI